MQELRQEAEIRRKDKTLVGTTRAKTLNYSKNIPAFDSNHIPERAAAIKSEVKLSILPDILGTKKSQWNPTVLLDRTKEYHQQASTRQIHFEIRKGLRDETTLKSQEKTIYEGVDTRNSFAGWNTSVEFSSLEHKKKHIQVNKEARYRSATKNRELLKDKSYIKPYDRQVNILDESRELKIKEKDIKSEFMQKVVHENPDISREKATAVVHKLVKDKKLKNGQEEFYGVKEESFHPDTSMTMKKNMVKKFKHDGIFQYSEALQKEIWSCCMAEDKKAQGCVVSYKDLDKWQILSFL